MVADRYSWERLSGSLVQAQQGDEARRDEVFAFLRTRLLPLARYRLREGAEDVVQDSLSVVHEHFSELDTPQRLLAFANAVLRNKIGNIYQSLGIRRRLS